MLKSTILHLRIPFSFYLMPVFLFAWSVIPDAAYGKVMILFTALHIFLYPASNGYNSYFDKDKSSIGGLESPPTVNITLYWISLLFDTVAILLAVIFLNWITAMMFFIYGLVSKAYSHPSVRLKKMPITGWLAAGVFQGYFTFLTVIIAIKGADWTSIFSNDIQFPAILSSLLLFGSYPMTQIYQHEEDSRRNDMTISRMLGIYGTFHFTAFFFSLSAGGIFYYLSNAHTLVIAGIFMLLLFPVLGYFSYWYLKSRSSLEHVNFKNTMRLNFISSLSINLFFAFLVFFQNF